MKKTAYCGYCDEEVEPNRKDEAGHFILVCSECGNAKLYTSRERYIRSEKSVLNKMKECDHSFDIQPAAGGPAVCKRCGLPKGSEPEDMVEPEAVPEKA